jgi:TonB family protein
VTSKARVLSKPEPTYTEAARKNQITGTVVLRAVFSSGGSVTNIHAVSGLPDGLTERAIAAAKSIRFVPRPRTGARCPCGWSCSTLQSVLIARITFAKHKEASNARLSFLDCGATCRRLSLSDVGPRLKARQAGALQINPQPLVLCA